MQVMGMDKASKVWNLLSEGARWNWLREQKINQYAMEKAYRKTFECLPAYIQVILSLSEPIHKEDLN